MTGIWLGLVCLAMFLVSATAANAYPEIHYRFAHGLSLLYRKQPEILFDTPHRIARGERLPIVLLVKDAHRFPIEILALEIFAAPEKPDCEFRVLDFAPKAVSRLSTPGLQPATVFWDPGLPGRLNAPLWWSVGYLETAMWPIGGYQILCKIRYRCRGKTHEAITDNLPGLSHAPLRVSVFAEPWPRFEGWYYGDPHCHSDKTMDQVEFAAPVPALARMAEALGVDWVAVTDHSYDLDIPPHEYVGIDPSLSRWEALGREIDQHAGSCMLIRGEEVSCGNAANHNVHLLVYDHPEMIPGRGDGGKRGFNLNNAPDLSLTEVIAQARDTVTFAAHPDCRNSWLERLILNRDGWQRQDRLVPDGMQVWNTNMGVGLETGIEQWKRMLLQGHRKTILAGSDAHGDFNRTRATLFPFVRLTETCGCFGVPRSYAQVRGELRRQPLLESIRTGHSVLTDGPIGIMAFHTGDASASIGDSLHAATGTLHIKAKSTQEFGRLQDIRIYHGSLGTEEAQYLPDVRPAYDVEIRYPLHIRGPGYLRLEIESRRGEHIYRCYTNPIWFESSPG